ncbi:pyruvate dehydrogenase E1 component alpha subunit [Anoxynatronum buryatiense]|uniref:Pyruvate dehydrogenase E1 component alpha subunit n=2 Tax=Anoxynatronum buryatiense TaxID=489973 RepID=A0AA46AJE8_9CLOT|nr:pyruvate dehydrogenase E1 component alpha subunit [Anoxynatronum buryatiense]
MYSKELLVHFYRTMVRIRRFEESISEFSQKGEIPGFVHLYIGEEAIATGVCANLTKKDYIQSTHRGHGHTIAKGAQVDRMMAELFGKKTGYCKGKGGSMHIADFSVGMLGANGIVGGGYNMAVGAGLAETLKGTDNISVVFFGDGASNRGTFHEALNMAAVWKLPVIFVCENNEWASTTALHEQTAVKDIAVRAVAYDIPGCTVDGNDVFAVYEAAQEAVERARRGEGPTLLEAKTLRIDGHFVGDPQVYRSREETMNRFKANDPIIRFEEKAVQDQLLSEEELKTIRDEVEQEIQEAITFALESPFPDVSELYTDLYV